MATAFFFAGSCWRFILAGVRNNRSFIWIATLILLLAGALRLPALLSMPPGLSQDEVVNGDIVAGIRNGKHALFFPDGFGHEPLYHYWSVPFQAALGDNRLSIRLPAVTLGLLSVAALIAWGRREFGKTTGALAGGALALSWWGIIFSRAGIRPILEMTALTFFGYFYPKRPWLAGIFLAASVYSYTAARYNYLLPILAVVLGWGFNWKRNAGNRRESRRVAWQPALIAAGLAFGLSLPMLWLLQSRPELQQRIRQLEGPLVDLRNGDPAPLANSLAATLGAVTFRGDPRWTYGLPNTPLFDWATGALFYLGLGWLAWRCRQSRAAFLWGWLALTALPSAVTPQAPSSVRLIGALPAICLGVGIGGELVSSWLKERGLPAWLIWGGFAALALLNIGRIWRHNFVGWGTHLETRLRYQTVLVEIADRLKEDTSIVPVITDGFYAPLDSQAVERNIGHPLPARWTQVGEGVAGALVLPASKPAQLFVPEYAPPAPQLLAIAGISDQPLFRSANQPSYAIYPLPAAPPIPNSLPAPIVFGGKLSLLGYAQLEVDDNLMAQWVTFWRIEGDLPDDLALFYHLVGADGELIAQHDGFDAAPATLMPGDVVVQLHLLSVSPEMPAAAWQIGAYTRSDSKRLTHPQPPFDRAIFDVNSGER